MQDPTSVIWWNSVLKITNFSLLLWVDSICIFALGIDAVLDWIELVSNRLSFILILSLKSAFITPVLFL